MSLDRIFEEAELLMNDVVDEWLGDVVEVSQTGNGGPWVERKCFVQDEAGALAHQAGAFALRALDGLDYRIRMKIQTSFIPDIGQARFRAGKLGARVWKASADQPESMGRYAVFDIQLAL